MDYNEMKIFISIDFYSYINIIFLMDKKGTTSNPAPNPTSFGKMLRIERINLGIKNAEKMAEALGITASMLSEIENGKKEGYPDIDFLLRCRDFFGWNIQKDDNDGTKREKIRKTLELIEKGLLDSKNILLNMNYFHNNRIPLLIKVILVLLFTPDSFTEQAHDQIERVTAAISQLYNEMEKLVTTNLLINNLPSPPIHEKITRKRKGKSFGL